MSGSEGSRSALIAFNDQGLNSRLVAPCLSTVSARQVRRRRLIRAWRIVGCCPGSLRSAEVRSDSLPTAEEAQARRDFLVMSFATELRARGHQVSALVD